MNIFRKIWKNRAILHSIFPTIYFNFHYLPFSQAVYLPILLYKPRFRKTRGSITINSKINFGMIRMGFDNVGVYPSTGISWENNGGKIIFNGKTFIGNSSFLAFGPNTEVIFGEDFVASAALKLISWRGITFGSHTSIGWDCLFMDTSFHPLYDMVNNKYKPASGKINIGAYNWFATKCIVTPFTVTPERCIFGMNTLITKTCVKESYCVMGGSPVRILSRNVMRDF